MKLFAKFSRYSSDKATEATKQYLKIAEDFHLKPSQMALAFVTSRPFVTSTIIGTTTIEQLKENSDSIHIDLNKDVLERIKEVHQTIPNPAP